MSEITTLIGLLIAVFALGFWLGIENERRRTPNDNLYRWDMARHLYGDKAARYLRECDEAHLGGDCPLCAQAETTQ